MSASRNAKQGAEAALRGAPEGVRSFAAKAGGWLQRTAGPAASPAPAPEPPPLPQYPTNRPLPLPDGLSEPDLRAVYASWSIEGEPVGHMDAYVADSFWRFVHTYGLAADLSGVALELGANPYFTTYLLDEHSRLDLRLANYFDGKEPNLCQRVEYVGADRNAVVKDYESVQFNVEEDLFPFDDESLDVVLFCEIIEHLLMNPVAVLREIAWILRPGGHVIVTTPNVCRLLNMEAMLHGRSIYDPYSGFGPYGRHNREYTMAELQQLLSFVGFDTVESFTADGHPCPPLDPVTLERIAPLLTGREHDLGHYLFVRATKVRESRPGLPDNLFRSWPDGEIVPA